VISLQSSIWRISSTTSSYITVFCNLLNVYRVLWTLQHRIRIDTPSLVTDIIFYEFEKVITYPLYCEPSATVVDIAAESNTVPSVPWIHALLAPRRTVRSRTTPVTSPTDVIQTRGYRDTGTYTISAKNNNDCIIIINVLRCGDRASWIVSRSERCK